MSPSAPKILLISTSSGSRGGGELYLVSLANELAAQGRDVACLLSTHAKMDELASQFSAEVEVLREAFTNTYDRRTRFLREAFGWQSVKQLLQILQKHNPALIHLNKQNLEDGLDWLRAIEKLRIPSVTTIHVPRSMRSLGARFGSLRDRMIAPILKSSRTQYVTVSQSSRDDLCRLLGLEHSTARVSVVPNGVTDSPRVDRESFRRQWNLTGDAFVLGTIARIEHQKNPLFAIRLLKELPANVHLVWVGDGRLRSQIEQLANDLGVSDRLHLDGWQHNARTRLAGFDAFILPSYFEGFPLAILEAMSASLPCIVSDADGNKESVIDGETGFVCALDNVELWKSRILELMNSAQLRSRMGEAGRQRFEQLYSVRAMAEATGKLYDELLAPTLAGVSP